MGFGIQGKGETVLLEAGLLDIAEKAESFPFIHDSCYSGIPSPQGRGKGTCVPGRRYWQTGTSTRATGQTRLTVLPGVERRCEFMFRLASESSC